MVNGAGAAFATNAGWDKTSEENLAALRSATSAAGAFALPVTSRDAALVVTVPPGRYTALVAGANNTTGVAFVEFYEVP